MFDFVRRLFRRPSPLVPKAPFITIVLEGDDYRVVPTGGFGNGTEKDGEALASLAILASRGLLLPTFQQALVKAGEAEGRQALAHRALGRVNASRATFFNGLEGGGEAHERPMVTPLEAFGGGNHD